jgi:hypothetical protein
MANSDVDIHFNNDFGTAERVWLNQQKLIFDARFWRWYRTLHFIACRVLGHEILPFMQYREDHSNRKRS